MKRSILLCFLVVTAITAVTAVSFAAPPTAQPGPAPETSAATEAAPAVDGDEAIKLEDLLMPEPNLAGSCCTFQEELAAERVCLRRGPDVVAFTFCTSSGSCTFRCVRI